MIRALCADTTGAEVRDGPLPDRSGDARPRADQGPRGAQQDAQGAPLPAEDRARGDRDHQRRGGLGPFRYFDRFDWLNI